MHNSMNTMHKWIETVTYVVCVCLLCVRLHKCVTFDDILRITVTWHKRICAALGVINHRRDDPSLRTSIRFAAFNSNRTFLTEILKVYFLWQCVWACFFRRAIFLYGFEWKLRALLNLTECEWTAYVVYVCVCI